MCPGVSPRAHAPAGEGELAAINKRKLLESAQKNLQKGALDKALKDYQVLLEADPRDANIRLKIGDLQLKRGQNDDAIAAYLKVADQFMRGGFDAKAVALYKQVTKIDPKRIDVHIPLADLYQRLGLTTDAMAALQTVAEAYQRDGRRREALELLRRMAGLDPTNTTSRLKVAELLQGEGLGEEALVEFEEAAAELGRQGDWEARANVLTRILEVAPNRIEALDALVTLWLEQNQPRRAEPFARLLYELDSERAESCENLASITAALGDQKGAIDLYRRAADAWIARGQDDRARAILQRHVPSEPFDLGGDGASQPGDAPAEALFGEEGIGGERPATDDEFRFDEAAAANVPESPRPGADGTLIGDDGPPELELEFEDEPAAAPVAPAAAAPAPKAAAPSPAAKPASQPAPAARATPTLPSLDDAPEQDVEQLLAEAAVYLRYGKHERAVASLEAALAQEPSHLGALEQLGEAHLRAEAPERAADAWRRAIAIAVENGEGARAVGLCARLEAIGVEPPQIERPSAAPATTILFDADADATPTPDGDVEFDADATGADGGEDEIEIDIDEDAFADAAPEGAGDEEAEAETGAEASVAQAAAEAAAESPAAADAAPEFEIDLDTAEFESTAPPETSGDATPVDDGDADAGPSAAASEAAAPLADAAAEDEIPGFDASAFADDEPESEPAPVADEAEAAPLADAAPVALQEPAPEIELTLEATAPPVAAEAPAGTTPAPGDLSGTSGQQIAEDLEEASFYFEQGLLDEAEGIYRRIVERAPNHPAALLRLGEIAFARGRDPAGAVSETGDVAEAPDAAPEAMAVEPPDDLDLTAREFGPNAAWQEDAAPAPSATDAAIADDVTEESVATPPAAPQAVAAEVPAVAETPAPPVAAPPAASVAPPAEAPAAAHAAPQLELTAPEFSAEEDAATPAFDLAAELSEALSEDAPPAARSGSTDDEGFSALFREFKRGVSRTLDEGDVETHFDLGIAYREMGLFEDAIGEFRYALGSGARRLDALHMMGLCALDAGRGPDAVGHLEQALASPELPEGREAPLRYDLGRVYEAIGDRARAVDVFERVVALDAGFQDAAERLEALRSEATGEPLAPEVEEAEAYESFDDLIAQSAEEAPARVEPAAETYESFDEFQAEDDGDEAAAPDVAPAAETEASVTEPVAEAQVEAAVAEPVAAEPEPVAEPEPPVAEEPPAEPEAPRRKRKISFF